MSKCPNIVASMRRWSQGGSLALIALFLMMFGPKIYDAIRGEPWIDNRLLVMQSSTGIPLIEDYTETRSKVWGLRVNTVVNQEGDILCSVEHHNTWIGPRKRMWRFYAFSGCPEPDVPYAVCSRFVVSSASGRTRNFETGCSAPVQPMTQEDFFP